MYAISCKEPGGPEIMEWVEHPTPTPKPDEVLIKVAAAGLNRADLLQRQGKYPPPPGASDIMGLEVAGDIVEIGANVTRWKTGDKVCALLSGGGYAEYVAVKAEHCFPKPANLSMIEAAVLPEALTTVHANVFETGALAAGEILLAHGGSSGIGIFALQMAKLHGAKVFVTVGSEEKAAACRKLGADLVINYREADFVERIAQTTAGRGVDVLLDMIGGDYIPRNLMVLATHGRHLSIATQHGRTATVDLRLIMQKRLTLTGSTLRGRSDAEKARLLRAVEEKWLPAVLDESINPLIYKSYTIKNIAEAHKMMESGAHIGKIAVEIG